MAKGFIPLAPGDFKVMIACCAWGNCSRCHGDGDKSKRTWFAISDGLSEAFAEQLAKSWKNFDAYVEPMAESDRRRREFFRLRSPPP